MKRHSSWIRRYFIAALVCAFAMALFNVIVDFNGIFGLVSIEGFNKQKAMNVSDRILKFYYAKRNKPESIIMGSSRDSNINPEDLEKYTHDRGFNFALVGSSIEEQYIQLKYLSQTYPIKTLVLGLDFSAFLHGVVDKPGVPPKWHFKAERLRTAPFIQDYVDSTFTISALQFNYETVKYNRKEKSVVIEVNENKGLFNMLKPAKTLDVLINAYPDTLKQYANGLYPQGLKNPGMARENLKYLKGIIAIAREKNIKCKFMVNPVNRSLHELLFTVGLGDMYEDWKRQVAQITDYYDFTGHNSINDDDSNWRDPSHAFTNVGTLMMARIYGDDKVAIPADFGVHITRENVDKHLENQRKGVQHWTMKEFGLRYDDKGNAVQFASTYTARPHSPATEIR